MENLEETGNEQVQEDKEKIDQSKRNDDVSLEVAGFKFETIDDAKMAAEEWKKITYIDEHLDYSNAEQCMTIYKKALETRTFQTPIGFSFMQRLRENLERLLPEEDIKSIPLYVSFSKKVRSSFAPAKQRIAAKEKERKEKEKFQMTVSVILNIILIIMIIAMFVITLDSSNPNILNYEENLKNRYASWEQELTDREQIVRQKEAELNIY